MSSWYSIVKFVPCSIKDERINIGIIMQDSNNTYIEFTKNWYRVKIFANEDISYLFLLISDFKDKVNKLNVKTLIENYSTLQLTSPRYSLDEGYCTFKKLCSIFLFDS